MELQGGIYIIIAIFLIVLAILWFLLPFAVFGTKEKLNELIIEVKKTNEQMEKLRADFLDRQ